MSSFHGNIWTDERAIAQAAEDLFRGEYPALAPLLGRKSYGHSPSMRIRVSRALASSDNSGVMGKTNVFLEYWSASGKKYVSVSSITDAECYEVKSSDVLVGLVRGRLREAMVAMEDGLVGYGEKPLGKVVA